MISRLVNLGGVSQTAVGAQDRGQFPQGRATVVDTEWGVIFGDPYRNGYIRQGAREDLRKKTCASESLGCVQERNLCELPVSIPAQTKN